MDLHARETAAHTSILGTYIIVYTSSAWNSFSVNFCRRACLSNNHCINGMQCHVIIETTNCCRIELCISSSSLLMESTSCLFCFTSFNSLSTRVCSVQNNRRKIHRQVIFECSMVIQWAPPPPLSFTSTLINCILHLYYMGIGELT